MNVSWSVTPATARFGHVELAQPIVHPYYATHGLAELADACDWSVDVAGALVAQTTALHEGTPTVIANVPSPEQALYGAAAFAEVLRTPEQFLVRRVLIAPVATRPMVQLPDGGWVTSHVNDLYRRVVNRNNRLKRLLELDAPAIITINEQRMLQEAACNLCFNGFPGLKVLTGPEREPLVSLFELAQSGADRVEEALDASGPAVGVRAFRVFEAIGLGTSSSRKHVPTPESRSKTHVDLSLSGSPVPIPEV